MEFVHTGRRCNFRVSEGVAKEIAKGVKNEKKNKN